MLSSGLALAHSSRDTRAMIALVAPPAALFIHFAPERDWQHNPRRHNIYLRAKTRTQTSRAGLRARIVRLTNLALLVRREALLRDFLVAARTERPLFSDPSIHKVAAGIEVSSTDVTLDFIGNPVIRARVTSVETSSQTMLLIVEITDAHGIRARAGIAVSLQPGETRVVELLCPQRLVPTSLSWSIMQL